MLRPGRCAIRRWSGGSAAETNADRSIIDPEAVTRTKVLWTAAALKAARLAWRSSDGRRFHHVTSDEIHGALVADAPAVIERRPLAPNSPYAAFKAGSNHVVRAYHRTYGLPVAIGNSSNNYGPRQHAEKFGPTVIAACRRLTPIPTYGDGSNRRDWMYVADHCRPPDAILRSGRIGET